jgi:hypothetical protein
VEQLLMIRFQAAVPRCDWTAIAVLVAILAVISVPSLESLATALR